MADDDTISSADEARVQAFTERAMAVSQVRSRCLVRGAVWDFTPPTPHVQAYRASARKMEEERDAKRAEFGSNAAAEFDAWRREHERDAAGQGAVEEVKETTDAPHVDHSPA